MNILKCTLLAAAISLSIGACATSTDKSGTRTMAQTIDDSTVTGAIKTMLLADERTKGFDINVNTANGVVTLLGGADSWAAKQAAGEIAASADGAHRVINQLVVAAAGSEARQDANTATASGEVREALDESGDGIDDAWITAKVKSQFLADDLVKGLDITVDTHANVVKLSGHVQSAAAHAQAIALARNTRGVRSVDATRLHLGD